MTKPYFQVFIYIDSHIRREVLFRGFTSKDLFTVSVTFKTGRGTDYTSPLVFLQPQRMVNRRAYHISINRNAIALNVTLTTFLIKNQRNAITPVHLNSL
jgi:hypothetical protein